MKGQMFIQFVILHPYFVFQISWLMVGEALPPLLPLTARHWFFSFRNLNNLRLPEKQSLPWTFSLCWNIFYLSGFLSKLRLPWKQSLPRNFSLYWIFFSHSGFLSNLRLTWKQSLPWKFSLRWIYFLPFTWFLSNLRLPWKTECALKFFTVLNIHFAFRIFKQLLLALKNREWPEFVLNSPYSFYHSEFWTTCACPEKQSLSWIHCIKYSRICLICHLKGIRKKWRIRRSDELWKQVKTLS